MLPLGAVARSVEAREQFTPTVNAELYEHRFQMVLDRVARDEEPVGDRTSVEPEDDGGHDVALALRE